MNDYVNKVSTWYFLILSLQLINWCALILRKELEGNTVELRRCQLAKGKAGTCEENEIMGNEAKICFGDEDHCNNSRNLNASFAILIFVICYVRMILSFIFSFECRYVSLPIIKVIKLLLGLIHFNLLQSNQYYP